MSIARAFALNASARRCPGARRGPDRTLTWLTLEAISQMAFPQEHENAKTRNNLKVFFFVVSCFRGFVIVRVYETRSSLLEAKPRGELKCARPAGAERLPHALVRLPERRRDDEVEVEVRQVRGVEDVEHLADQTKLGPSRQRDRLHDPDVLRREDVVELEIRR